MTVFGTQFTRVRECLIKAFIRIRPKSMSWLSTGLVVIRLDWIKENEGNRKDLELARSKHGYTQRLTALLQNLPVHRNRIGCTRFEMATRNTTEPTVTSPLVRTTRLVTAYRRYLTTADSPCFAAEVDEHYSASTLATLLNRADVEMRRAAALALGMLGNCSSIEPLGRSLSDSDRGVRLATDDSFRALLVRDAAPLHHQQLLKVMHLNDGGEHAAALAPTMILVDQAGYYAEAHHQLAICWHGLENHYQAEAAYGACLWHCRFHYPAWQGLARCRVVLEDYRGAVNALERCLQICPDIESARLQIRLIRRRISQKDA